MKVYDVDRPTRLPDISHTMSFEVLGNCDTNYLPENTYMTTSNRYMHRHGLSIICIVITCHLIIKTTYLLTYLLYYILSAFNRDDNDNDVNQI